MKQRPDRTSEGDRQVGMTSTDRAGGGYAGYGNVITEEDRALWREVYEARAQDAFHRGEQALAENDILAARFWLGRAGRMARNSPNIVWALALVDLRTGRFDDALSKMRDLRERFALREAAFLEVECLARLTRWDEALERLRHALSVSVIMPDFLALPHAVVEHCGQSGWCFASNAGSVQVFGEGRVTVALDGQTASIGRAGVHKLPEGWSRARKISVKIRGRHLVGSPIDVAALTRIESLVTADEKGLSGWAWYPADPEYAPRLRLWDGSVCTADDFSQVVDSDVPLARPRAFRVPLRVLPAGSSDLLMLHDDHGRPLTGAPIRPDMGLLLAQKLKGLPDDLRPQPVKPRARKPLSSAKARGCCVVIPVYRGRAVTKACLESVCKTVPAGVRILVIDDATPEPDLAADLDALAQEGRIELLRMAQNQGFPVAVNRGLKEAAGHDVILLNSDAVVPPGWVERILRRLHVPGVGTVTPLSNDASIFSYPSVDKANLVPSVREALRIDRVCRELFYEDEASQEVPTANGFCMAISAACLQALGVLREDVFAQGYGEENDFCLRASACGFSHRVAPDVYVLHRGSVSFGGGKRWLMARNLKTLNALHPGYDAYVARFIADDPLRGIRRELDRALLRKDQTANRGSVVMILHASGGGVERVVRERAAAFEQKGLAAYVLIPTEKGCHVTRIAAKEDEHKCDPLNLLYDLPQDEALLIECLAALKVQHIEWHQLIGHAPLIRRLHEALRVPYDVFVHDHVWFCPRISLLNGHGRYCGEPDVAECEACVTRWGDVLNEGLSIQERIGRSQKEFEQARRCITPSEDTTRRFQRHFPSITFKSVPLEDDEHLNPTIMKDISRRGMSLVHGRPLRLCIVGGIGQWKGYDVLIDMARIVKENLLPIEIILVGHTPNDNALISQGVIVTGEYMENEALNLIKEHNPDLGFIPSISPETWCYSLSLLWKSGLEAVCFDIGAQAERVKRKNGIILPLGASSLQLLRFILKRWYR